MNNEGLKYIFSDSACLTAKQMRHYVLGEMANEESYAVELHLNSCPFCSEAIEGMFAQQEGAAAMVTELDTDFLKEHFSLHNPQVHLNSMAPAQPVAQAIPVKRRRRMRSQPLWRPSGIAAMLLLGAGLLWYFEFRPADMQQRSAIAQAMKQDEAASANNTAVEDRTPANIASDEVQPSPATSSSPKILADAAPQMQEQKAAAPLNGGENPQAPQQPVIMSGSKESDDDADTKKIVKTADKEEVKAPLIDANDNWSNTTEEIEKMPSRSTGSIAATAAGTYAGNTPRINKVDAPRAKAFVKESSPDDLYNSKNYSAALKLYRQQMNDADRGKRQFASIQAARCYLALGNTQEATKILLSIAEEGGPQKRAAKRMLRDLEKDKE